MSNVQAQYPAESPDSADVFGGTPIPPAGSETTALEQQGLIGPGVKPTYWQNVFNRAVQVVRSGPTASLMRMSDQTSAFNDSQRAVLEGSSLEKLTPTELNAKYPGISVPFKEPMYDAQAKLMWDNQQRDQRLQAWISKGPDIGFWGDMIAGTPLMADPINMVLFGGLGALGRLSGVAGKLEGPGLAKLAGRTGLTFGENYAGIAAGEIPNQFEQQAEHQNVPPFDFTAPLGGAAVGTAFHFIMSRAWRSQEGVPEATRRAGVIQAVKQEESGSRINMAPFSEVQALRDQGAVADAAQSRYEYSPLKNPHASDFYVAADPEGHVLNRASPEFGGTVGVQNPERANNVAGVPESEHQGQVIRARLSPDAKVLNADTSFTDAISSRGESPAETLKSLKAIVGDEKWKTYEPLLKEAMESKATVGDTFNAFSRLNDSDPTATHDLSKIFQGRGYDGIQSVAYHEGEPIDNQVHVWNQDHLEPLDATPGDRSSVPTYQDLNSDTLKTQSPEQAQFYDADANARVEDAGLTPERQIEPEDPGLNEVEKPRSEVIKTDADEREQEVRASLDAMIQEPGNEHIQDEIDKIDRDFKRDQLEIDAAKKMAKCMAENMT